MPADMYSLGIGIEYDPKSARTVVDKLTNALKGAPEEIAKIFGTRSDYFDPLGMGIDRVKASVADLIPGFAHVKAALSDAFSDKKAYANAAAGIHQVLQSNERLIAKSKEKLHLIEKELAFNEVAIHDARDLADTKTKIAKDAALRAKEANALAEKFGGVAAFADAANAKEAAKEKAKVAKGAIADLETNQKRGVTLEKKYDSAKLRLSETTMRAEEAAVATVTQARERSVQLAKQGWDNALGTFKEVAAGFGQAVQKLRGGFDFTKDAEELEKSTIRMAVGMGGGWKEADHLRDSVIDLGLASSKSLQDITKLAVGLSHTGASVTDFSTETQVALVSLSSNFGISGEEISKTSKTLGTFGMDLGDTLGSAVAFQKGFKVPGVFEQLPGVVDFARDSVLSFSDKVVGSGADIVKAALHTAGAFSKAFGTTMADAVKRAEGAMGKFANAAQQDQDVFLGLSTEFSSLTMSLMQAGVPIQRAMNLTQMGIEDAVGAAQQYRAVIDTMPNQFMKQKFMRQLQKELPHDLFALVQDTQLLQKTLSDRKAAAAIEQTFGGQGVSAFNDMTNTMQSATAEARDLFNNVVHLGEAVFGQIGKMMGFDKMLIGARDSLHNFNLSIKSIVQSDGFKSFMETIKPVVVGVGKVFLALGTVIGGVVGSLGSLGTAWKLGTKGFKLAEKPIEMLAHLFPRLSRGLGMVATPFKFLGRLAGKLVSKAGPIGMWISAFEGIKTAVMDMGEILGDPNATGLEKFGALIRGSLKGIGSFVDSILLGIPSMIMGSFFPDMEKSFNDGFDSLWDKVSGWFDGPGGGISSMISAASDKLAGWIGGLGDFMLAHLPDMKKWGAGFGRALGQTIGGLGKMLATGVKALFYDFPKVVVGFFRDAFKGGTDAAAHSLETDGKASIVEGAIAIFGAVGDTILTAFGEIGKGIISSFGLSIDSVGSRFAITWETIKSGAESAVDWIADAFTGFFLDSVPRGINDLNSALEKFLIVTIPHNAKVGIALLETGFDAGWMTIKAGAFDLVAGVTGAFADMAKSTIDSFERMLKPLKGVVPGVDKIIASLEDAKGSVAGLADSMTAAATQERKNALDSVLAGTQRIAAIETEKQAELDRVDAVTKASNDRFSREQKAREALTEANHKGHEQRLDDLSQQLAVEEDLVDTQQKRATDARRFQKEARKGIDTTLASFATEGEKAGVGGTGITAGSKALRDYMDKSIASIASDVEKGALTVEQASDRLKQAGAGGLDTARVAAATAYKQTREIQPGETATRAGAPTPESMGVNSAAMQQMFANFKQSAANARVDVTLKGGDDVTRAMARKTQVDAFNSGN